MDWPGRTLLVVVELVALAVMVGCGPSPQERYDDVHARLNRATSQINFPLESYALSPSEVRTVAHANDVRIGRCLEQTGRKLPALDRDWESIDPIPDRRYGVWSMADAQYNGYHLLKAEKRSKELAAQADNLSDGWWDAYTECRSSVNLLPRMGAYRAPDGSPVAVGMHESFDALLASDVFDRVYDQWSQCISGQGLTPNPDSTVLSPVIPKGREDQIRVATLDVRCKESLSSVQKLADYEARYQMGYIADHESVLQAYRQKADRVLERARTVIATYGA